MVRQRNDSGSSRHVEQKKVSKKDISILLIFFLVTFLVLFFAKPESLLKEEKKEKDDKEIDWKKFSKIFLCLVLIEIVVYLIIFLNC
jgi:hypothetical protein